MKRNILSLMALLAATILMNISAQAASPNGVAGSMPAYYDDELFTVNFKEEPDKAADALIEHNGSINIIYECDSCPGFIAVLDAIQGDGFNPLWLEVQIEFTAGHDPRQLTSDTDIEDAANAGEITLTATDEVYRCAVIGKPEKPQ